MAVFFICTRPALSQDEYAFDLKEIEKKPYSISGFLEFRPVLFGLNRDSAFYRLKYFNQDPASPLEQYNLGLRLEGGYEKGPASFNFKADGTLRFEDEGEEQDLKLLEGYLSLKPNPSFIFNAGKRVVSWGKGYAFNPAAFVSRPKDPNDPAEAREGYFVFDADLIRSYKGPLKTVAFTPVILPVAGDMNDDFSKKDGLNFAAKLYLLLYDTDLDVMLFSGASRTTRYGLDFSRNIRTNFEVHGEAAWITDFEKKSIDSQGKLSTETADVLQTLLGLRYLTTGDITYIIEYYHNGGGIDEESAENFFRFVDGAYDTFLSTGKSSALVRASQLSQGSLAAAKPMQDYLYARASIKEPFDILYLTPAATLIFNLSDQSFSLTPELAYSPVTNLEFRLRCAFLTGDRQTEYGEKLSVYKLELRVRYFF